MSYLAPNYTQIPNLLLEEHIKVMTEAEMRVALAIARKTFGWHKRQDRLSLSQLMALTGMSRQGVINGVEAGIARGIIRREQDGQGYLYELIITDRPVNEVDQSKSAKTSQRSRLELVNEVDQLNTKTSQRSRPTKERNKRNKSKKADQGEGSEIAPPPARPTATPGAPATVEATKKPLLPNDGYEMRQPPASEKAPSGEPTQKQLQRWAPQVDPRKFRNGYIPTGAGATPVEVWYESFAVTDAQSRLTAPDQDDLRGLADLDRLRKIVATFRRCGFKRPKNIQLILDWYQNGIPEKYLTPPNGAAPTPPPAERVLDFNWEDV